MLAAFLLMEHPSILEQVNRQDLVSAALRWL